MTTLSQPSTPVVKRFTYPLDQTGKLASNLIKKEYHTITPQNRTPQNVIIPGFAPYYRHSLIIRERRNSASVPLREGIDYTCEWPVLSTGNQTEGYTPLYIGIQFIDEQITGEFELEYQTVGGQFALDGVAVAQALANNAGDPLTTTYEQILGKPLQLPPIEHVHSINDFVGFNDLVQELINLRDAIVAAWREDRDAHPGYETLIDEYFRLLDELEKTNTELDNQVTNIAATIERLNNQFTNALNALREEVQNDIQNKIKVINNNLDALRAALTQTEQNLRDFITSNFNTFKQQTNDALAAIRTTMADNKRDIEAKLNTAKTELNNSINTLRSDLTVLINNEKTRNDTQDTKILAIENRLKGNEFVKTANVNQTVDGIKTFKKGVTFGYDTTPARGVLTADADNLIIQNKVSPATSTLKLTNNGVMSWAGARIEATASADTSWVGVDLKIPNGNYTRIERDPADGLLTIKGRNAEHVNQWYATIPATGSTVSNYLYGAEGTALLGHGNWLSQKTSLAPFMVRFARQTAKDTITFAGSTYYPLVKMRGRDGTLEGDKTVSMGWVTETANTRNGSFVFHHISPDSEQTFDANHYVWQFKSSGDLISSHGKWSINNEATFIEFLNQHTSGTPRAVKIHDNGIFELYNPTMFQFNNQSMVLEPHKLKLTLSGKSLYLEKTANTTETATKLQNETYLSMEMQRTIETTPKNKLVVGGTTAATRLDEAKYVFTNSKTGSLLHDGTLLKLQNTAGKYLAVSENNLISTNTPKLELLGSGGNVNLEYVSGRVRLTNTSNNRSLDLTNGGWLDLGYNGYTAAGINIFSNTNRNTIIRADANASYFSSKTNNGAEKYIAIHYANGAIVSNMDKLQLGSTADKTEVYRGTDRSTFHNSKNGLKADLLDNGNVSLGTGNKLGTVNLAYTNTNNVDLSFTNGTGFNITQTKANKSLTLQNDGLIKWGGKDILVREGWYLRNYLVPTTAYGGFEITRAIGTETQNWRFETLPTTDANNPGAFKLYRSNVGNGLTNANKSFGITFPIKDGTVALTSDLTKFVTLDTAQTITGRKRFDSPIDVTTAAEIRHTGATGLQILNKTANKYLELHNTSNYLWTNYDNFHISAGKTKLSNSALNIDVTGAHAGVTSVTLGEPGTGWGRASFVREQSRVIVQNHKTTNNAKNARIALTDDGYLDFYSNVAEPALRMGGYQGGIYSKNYLRLNNDRTSLSDTALRINNGNVTLDITGLRVGKHNEGNGSIGIIREPNNVLIHNHKDGSQNSHLKLFDNGHLEFNSNEPNKTFRFGPATYGVNNLTLKDPANVARSFTLGVGGTDIYLRNAVSNKYLQLKNDGTLAYSNDNILLNSLIRKADGDSLITSSGLPWLSREGTNTIMRIGNILRLYRANQKWSELKADIRDNRDTLVMGYIDIQDFFMRSDKRAKEDIKPIDNALDAISKITGYTFKLKGTESYTAGVVAQQLQEVLPDLVAKGETDEDMLSVKYNGLFGYLIEAVKELKTKNDKLEERLSKIESKLDSIINK